MDGCLNTWNVRSYAPRNQPPAHFEYYRNCSKEKLTVWAGLIGSGEILGQYFFEGNMTGNTYLAMIDHFVVPNIRSRFEERNNVLLEDGGYKMVPSASSKSRDSTAERALWKPDSVATRSPDLTPLFFLLGVHQRPSVHNISS